MTNKELQEELKKYPDDVDMWIDVDVKTQTINSVNWIKSLSVLTNLTVRCELNQLTLMSKIK